MEVQHKCLGKLEKRMKEPSHWKINNIFGITKPCLLEGWTDRSRFVCTEGKPRRNLKKRLPSSWNRFNKIYGVTGYMKK